MKSFSAVSSAVDSARMPPPAPPAPSSAGDGVSPPAPPRAYTTVTSSGQGIRMSSSIGDYALPLPTRAMRSEKPVVGAMSIAAEMALARKSSLRGSRDSLSAR